MCPRRLQRLGAMSVIALTLVALAGTVQAAPFDHGDVFAATGQGTVLHYDSAGTLIETITVGSGLVAGLAFDDAGDLYVARFVQGDVRRFRGTTSSVTDLGTFGSGYSGFPESIIFDAAGQVYVGAVVGSIVVGGDNDVRRFTPAGVPSGQFDVPVENRGSDWIDLAADQHTLFYTSEGRHIFRYDVATSTPLADFAVLPDQGDDTVAFAFRLLGDGGLLVADSSNIKRLDSTGAIVQTYDDVDGDGVDIDNWFALNLDPDGTSFWSADLFPGSIRKFDIATGEVLLRIDTGIPDLAGLAVVGEFTQARSSRTQVASPGPVLLLFGAGLAVAAARAVRAR